MRLIFSGEKRRKQTSLGLGNPVEVVFVLAALRSLLYFRLNWLIREVIEFFEVDSGGLRTRLCPLAAEESADTGEVKGDDKGTPRLDFGLRMLP